MHHAERSLLCARALSCPSIAAETWKLELRRRSHPFVNFVENCRQQPRQTLPATLKSPRTLPAKTWSAVHAEWVGVSLGKLLEKARPLTAPRSVRLHGFDSDPGGGASYFRGLPLEKAMHPLTLLAHRMNGARLPPEHGFPLRAVIPGWYGMDWVKWLRSVEVSTEAGASPAMGVGYIRQVRSLLSGSRTRGRFARFR